MQRSSPVPAPNSSPRPDVPPARSRRVCWPGLALVAITVVAYLPALAAGFIWDDDHYLTANPNLADLAGLLRMWWPGNTPQYYPAVFTMFWLEHQAWGLDPVGYHAVNIALHALNALLLWRLARALALPAAWLLAALFALHPVHVESVAWITERKNVLSGCLYLLAALAYLRFDSARQAGVGNPWRTYATAILLFALALLAKTVTCSLPAALILIWLWRGERVTWRRLAPLLPFFALGLVLGLHTAHLERVHVGASGPDFAFTAVERLLIASRALLFYPSKLLAPWPLVFIYPRWQIDSSAASAYLPLLGVVVTAVAAGIAFWRGRRGPAVALAFFAGTLFPALGFFDIYPMRFSFVADHFQYLASIGFLALVVGTASRWLSATTLRVAGAAALLACAVLTWRQCEMYADQPTLWQTTLAHNPEAYIAHNNLAALASARGDDAAALTHLESALACATGEKAEQKIRGNMALALANLRRFSAALAQYRELQRRHGGQELAIARTLEQCGRDEEAHAEYRKLLEGELRADSLVPAALHLLGRGLPEQAVPLLEEHLAQAGADLDARMFLADALAAVGRTDDAVAAAERAIELAKARGDTGLVEKIATRQAQYRRGPARRAPR